MDCLCCADGGAGPSSDTEFLGSLCHLDDPRVKFPAERGGRYHLYVVAGCPFAARAWICASFYGLTDDVIKIVKCFPASYDQGWFFEATSDGEKHLVQAYPGASVDACPHGSHHLSQMYAKANPNFRGAISVPLLWDSKTDTAVSNSSLRLAEMICTELVPFATRNSNVRLYPCRQSEPDLYIEHDDLVKMLHAKVTAAVYRMNDTNSNGELHDRLVDEYYATLDSLQARIESTGAYLTGEFVRFADLVLFISLVRLDLAYQWRFGLGRKNVREDYPVLQAYQRRIMSLPGVAATVLPRDIMALYFMTKKWTDGDSGRTLPQVPAAWVDRTYAKAEELP
jgi:glutathionyl-hydroquinone reductase